MRIGNPDTQRASSFHVGRSAAMMDLSPNSPLRSPANPSLKEPLYRGRFFTRSFLDWIAIVAFCCMWLSGCVSILASRKGSPSSDKKIAATKGLIKPRLADSLDPGAPNTAESRDKGNSDGKQASGDRFGSDEKPAGIAKTLAALDQRGVDKSPPPGKKTVASTKSLREPLDEALPAKRESVNSEVPPKPTGGKKAGSSSADKTKDSNEIGFKKHDHSKYISLIRGKAIDQVNKEKDVVLARICRNTTTEEWSLTLYRKRKRTYSFASYVWDEIDEKFEQAFVSDQRPISGWKQHLQFMSSDKECMVLKGSPP
jgi:hypothetical protein